MDSERGGTEGEVILITGGTSGIGKAAATALAAMGAEVVVTGRNSRGDPACRHDRLDVLVNNAGLIQSRRAETPDGIEFTLAVNHLAAFLLTNLPMDRKEVSPAQPRDEALQKGCGKPAST